MLVQPAVPHVGSLWCQTPSQGQSWTSITDGPFSSSAPCLSAGSSSRRHVSQGSLSGRKIASDRLWREFFADPSQWWDHRSEKVNPRYPDFKHKKTQQALWLDNSLNPPWVEAELAAMAPGTLQSNIFSWNVSLQRHAKAGDYLNTIDVFQQMQREGMLPDSFSFVQVLNACSSLRSIKEGRRVHEQIIQRGCESDDYVTTCLVDMYAKCGSIEEAWTVFNKMQKRDVVSWNAIIGGYVKSGQGLKAMELFKKMQNEGVEPSSITFVGVLSACASVAALDEGRCLHEQIIRRGFESDVYVATCLVDMYAKCASIENAWSVFNKMREHNVVSWNAIIWGCVKSRQDLETVTLLRKMVQEGVEPDSVTFAGLLNSCARTAALEEGRHVHEEIIKRGYESDNYVTNCLVDMYAKCGSIEDAFRIFDNMLEHDVVSWNTMIGCFLSSGQGLNAMALFRKMLHARVEPDKITFVGLLNSCASIAALEEGRCVHDEIIRRGCESDNYVATCLVDMYAKCGSIDDAWSVFNNMHEHDVVSWNAMIGGFVKSGKGPTAVALLRKMQQEGVEPDRVTFLGLVNSCARIAALEEGRCVHDNIILRGCESDVCVANSLVDMYAKSGSIEDAWSMFNAMKEHNVVSWNAIVGGYAMHGHAKKAIGLFKRMVKEGVEINGITLTCLLSACSHGGLVKEGLRHFNSISSCYNIVPTMEHYTCLVDLLGRAGQLEEAEEIIKRMPVERDASAWMALLGACRNHGNVEMGERSAKRCLELDPEDGSGHVLLSNIYAATGK